MVSCSCSNYRPASELMYNGMYPYYEGFGIKDEHTKQNCYSYGHTTKGEDICLSREQIKLLSTRGGNCPQIRL